MFRPFGFHRLLRDSLFLFEIYGFRSLCSWKNSNTGMHFLHNRNKPMKPNKRFHRHLQKPAKPARSREHTDPKQYMRDIVGNVYRILKYSTWDSAQEQLEKLPMKWDSYTVNQILKTHPPMEKAWLFFNWADRLKGFKHDQFTYTTMLDIFGEAGRISSMQYVFQLMLDKGIKVDAVTYTSMMHWLSNHEDVDGAINVWKEMRANGCKPTVVSYTAYMKVLFDNNRQEQAVDVYKEMIVSGLAPNCHTYTILMEHLLGCGKCKEAIEIFGKMQEAGVQPDKVACNILIEKCSKVGEIAAMDHILQYMKQNSLVLRYPVFLGAVEAFKAANQSDALLRQVNPQFLISNEEEQSEHLLITSTDAPSKTERGLLLMFLKKENFNAIGLLLSGIMDKNLDIDSEVISTIIEASCDYRRLDEASLAYECSCKKGIIIKKTSYLALIGNLLRSNSFERLVQVVEEMLSAGHTLGVYHSAALIYRLGCARRPTFAAKVFDLLPSDHRSTATYTALISVYFLAGSAEKAITIYKSMQNDGFSPALGTYIVLIAGLEKSGRHSDAESFRKEKKGKQNHSYSQDKLPMEEKICDLLFGGNMLY